MSKSNYMNLDQVLAFIVHRPIQKIRIYDKAGDHTLSIVPCADTSMDFPQDDPFYGSGYDLVTSSGEHLWCGLSVNNICLLTLAAVAWETFDLDDVLCNRPKDKNLHYFELPCLQPQRSHFTDLEWLAFKALAQTNRIGAIRYMRELALTKGEYRYDLKRAINFVNDIRFNNGWQSCSK